MMIFFVSPTRRAMHPSRCTYLLVTNVSQQLRRLRRFVSLAKKFSCGPAVCMEKNSWSLALKKKRSKLGPTRYMFVLPGATVDGNQKSEINSPVELVKYPQNNIPYLQGFSHQNPPVFGLGISPKIPIGFWGLELCKRPWMEVDIVAMNSVMVTAGDRGTSDEVTPKNVVKSKGILPVDPWSFRFRNFHTQNYLCGNFEGIPL